MNATYSWRADQTFKGQAQPNSTVGRTHYESHSQQRVHGSARVGRTVVQWFNRPSFAPPATETFTKTA